MRSIIDAYFGPAGMEQIVGSATLNELNHNELEWLPEHIRAGQFGKWLEGARDWNISRAPVVGLPRARTAVRPA